VQFNPLLTRCTGSALDEEFAVDEDKRVLQSIPVEAWLQRGARKWIAVELLHDVNSAQINVSLHRAVTWSSDLYPGNPSPQNIEAGPMMVDCCTLEYARIQSQNQLSFSLHVTLEFEYFKPQSPSKRSLKFRASDLRLWD
jgi:hypothetical protein